MTAPCLYDKAALLKWVCTDANNDVFDLEGKRINLHVHCAWVSCSCPHHIREDGRDHTSCKCPKTARTSPAEAPSPRRVLRRPTPKPAAEAGDGVPAAQDRGGVGPIVDGVRRRAVRPHER